MLSQYIGVHSVISIYWGAFCYLNILGCIMLSQYIGVHYALILSRYTHNATRYTLDYAAHGLSIGYTEGSLDYNAHGLSIGYTEGS